MKEKTSTLHTFQQCAWMMSFFKFLTISFLGSILLIVSSKIVIPFVVVGGTPAQMVVILLGALMGRTYAVGSVIAFLAQGAMGLPVFIGTPEKGIGLAYMAGPTAGFLTGYLVAAFLVGMLADRGWGKTLIQSTLMMFTGMLCIHFFGATWLSYLFGFEKALTIEAQYLIGDFVVKLGFGAAIIPLFQSKIRVLLNK